MYDQSDNAGNDTGLDRMVKAKWHKQNGTRGATCTPKKGGVLWMPSKPEDLLCPEDVAHAVEYLLSLSGCVAVDEIYLRRRKSEPF